MPKRIPHTDLEVITGAKTTQDYLAMQKKLGRFYFKDFFARLDQLNTSGRLLEVGPGPGYQTALVAEKYHPEEIVGLEYSPDMIRIAEEYVGQQGLQETIRFVNGAVEDAELIDGLGTFDLVYTTFSLHHWADPSLGIKNLYRCLKDNGTLYIYDFHRGGIFYYLKIKKGMWESIRAAYTMEEMENMLQALGIHNYQLERPFPYMSLIAPKTSDS